MLGTAAYLSPEQARGEEAGPSSDIYSLGVCAYQFLTGRLPHEYASLTELALKQQQDPVAPVDGLPAGGAARAGRGGAGGARARSGCALLERARDGRGDRGGRARRGDRCHPAARHERLRRDRGDRRDRGHEGDAAHDPRPVPRPACTTPPPAARPRRGRRGRRARRGRARRRAAALGQLPRPARGHRRDRGRRDRAALVLGRGGGVDSVDTGDVQQQIDGLRDFIAEHSR